MIFRILLRNRSRRRIPDLPRRQRAPLAALLALLAFVGVGAAQEAADDTPRAAYTVLLEAPSVGERLREEPTKSQPVLPRRNASSLPLLRRAVLRAQDPVMDALRAMDVEVVRATHSVLNAIFVRATPAQAEAIRALPEVAGVVSSQRYEPMLKNVADIVNVDVARIRPAGTGLLGDGLKIAIIDSGLDFDHPAFRDETLPALRGYPKGDRAFRSLASRKVIAVRSYVDLLNSEDSRTSSPDDDSPWDAGGHGTPVAMIAAGRQVSTPHGIISGIAPKARIGVYKVFGTPRVNFYTNDQVIIAAIDDAVNDDMDILNLSLGNLSFWPWDASGRDCSQRSASSACDPLAAAAQSAVTDFGKVVVVAAGNNGLRGSHSRPSFNTINSPGNAPAVITVGGTGNAIEDLQVSVRIGDRAFDALSGTGPDAGEPLVAPAAIASDYGDTRACEPFPSGSMAGRIVLIDRGECFFLVKVEHADAAGAIGVVIANHFDNDLVGMALLEDTDIPAFFVGRDDGTEMRRLIASGSSHLTLDPTPVEVEAEWNRIYASSSRGPTLALIPKPDLVAPAASIYTATPRYNDQGNLFAPSGFRQQGGTSFAAPAVAGAAALVWEAFPTLSSREVSSALVNSARQAVFEGDEPARLRSSGAGVLDIGAALRPTASVTPSSIAFGDVRSASFPIRKELTVRNKSASRQSFRVTVDPRDESGSASVQVVGLRSGEVRLEPHGTAQLQVSLTGGRPPPGSYEGRIRLTSASGNGGIQIPYLFVVGDNEPFNSLKISGGSAVGIRGEAETTSLTARVTDQYGVPVAGRRVTFEVVQGPGRITHSNNMSGPHGLIHARVRYGALTSEQRTTARIGNLEINFNYEATGEKPEVLGITNMASELSPRGVAAGGLVRISGRNFASFASGENSLYQTAHLSIVRKGVSVAFDVGRGLVSEPGRILGVGEDWVDVQVPWELARSPRATVKVRSGNHSEPFQFTLTRHNPGIFSHECDGLAVAAALLPDSELVSLDKPARRGIPVTILMTGNGPVSRAPPNGEAPALPVSTVVTPTATVGGVSARVTQSVLMPEATGMYSVTLVVPVALQPGNHPLRINFNHVESNVVMLPVE